MKLKALLLALTILGAANFSANASPVKMTGDKGVYILDLEAGTYKGCINGNGCIFLGPRQKSGPQAWQNGAYEYEIRDTEDDDVKEVVVIKDASVIFRDTITPK